MNKTTTVPSPLALNLVTYFSTGSGEFGIKELAALFGIDRKTLTRWSKVHGYLFGDGLIGEECWPMIWREFADLSPIAAELSAAFEQLLSEAGAGSAILNWADRSDREAKLSALRIAHLPRAEQIRVLTEALKAAS